jgi:hypothetical protein
MKPSHLLLVVLTGVAASRGLAAQSGQSDSPTATAHTGHVQMLPSAKTEHSHAHGTSVPAITYAELERTAEQLAAARRATEKYQDVSQAEAAGYRAVGPDAPGMGIHYVRQTNRQQFSVTEPPILLYEPDPAAPRGLRLVGVSYLLVAPADADGQPENPPFPKALASWHKHNNVCVLPDNTASVNLSESQCTERGGRFTAETSWMVHAWIWKDSPAGVFSSANPLVK